MVLAETRIDRCGWCLAAGYPGICFFTGAFFCGDGRAADRCLAEGRFWLCGALRLGVDGRDFPADGAGGDGGGGSEVPGSLGF
ncbi:hypothetical protein D3C78_1505510 [compost metagenome]